MFLFIFYPKIKLFNVKAKFEENCGLKFLVAQNLNVTGFRQT